MGRRLQTRRARIETRALLRLTVSYLAVFSTVIVALSAIAYALIESNYRSIVAPALATPEGRAGFAAAMRPTLLTIVWFDVALALVVGALSYALARAALRPLVVAREREERFTADVAHELRTPLAAIATLAQAAATDDLSAARAAFGTIARRALESSSLVGDLLTLARGSDGDALLREPVDLAIVVDRVLRERSASGPISALRFDLDVASTIVDGDERRLLQLARNLVANAERHAGSCVFLRVRRTEAGATLEIEDDGPGVDAEVVPRLFERFAKGEGSRGTGLGLAICRWVARAHGGEISYIGGSHFVVVLPSAP